MKPQDLKEQLQQIVLEHQTYLHHNNPSLLGQLKQLLKQEQILYVLERGWDPDYPDREMGRHMYYWSLNAEEFEKEKLAAQQEYPNAEFEVRELKL